MRTNLDTRKIKTTGKDLFNYAYSLNLIKNGTIASDTLVIPNSSHFFYEEDEVAQFKNIVDVRKLNSVPHLADFIYTLYKMTTPGTVYCGRFINNKSIPSFSKKGIMNRLNRAIDLLNPASNRYLSEKDIITLFESHSFKIMDMKVTRRVTQFYAKRI